MVNLLSHRGPDDSGIEIIRAIGINVGLGHRRLAILDLTATGHQPMRHTTGSCIVYNGEIYNYKELRKELITKGIQINGNSDTEVLLNGLIHYGEEFISKLEGMFAFAFFDNRRKYLLLSRDPLGIKPLYTYQKNNESFVFASEVRSLMASNLFEKKIDQTALRSYLAYGSVQDPNTLIDGVSSLCPGSLLLLNLNENISKTKAENRRFWKFPETKRQNKYNKLECTDIATALEDAVKKHLVSDVPVGLFLSSGIDSTIVAGLASRYESDLTTFTVDFIGRKDLSEADMAAETAKRFGLRHQRIPIDISDAKNIFSAWMSDLDQPSIDGLNVYLISKAVGERGIKVALSGQGADELFGGYPSFFEIPRLLKLLQIGCWVPPAIRRPLAALFTINMHTVAKTKFADLIESKPDPVELTLRRRRLLSNGELRNLGMSESVSEKRALLKEYHLNEISAVEKDTFSAISYAETRFYLGNTLLRNSDMNGMAHGLEIRVPFLHTPLIDRILPLPGDVRAPSRLESKYLLRECFKEMLRPELLKQKKRGFMLPIADWLLGPLFEVAEDSLNYLRENTPLPYEGIKGIQKSFIRAPQSPISSRFLALVVLGNYLKRHKLMAY